MEENLKWLWYAFSAAWIIHLVYLLSIAQREKKLRRQIEDLKSLLDQAQKEQQEASGG